MGQLKEYIKIAVMNIRHNKGRSILTMLGIIIGISSVIMVLSIGNGVRAEINGELDSMAGGQVALYVDSTRKDTTVSFTQEDLEFLTDNIDHIDGASNQDRLWGTAEGPKGSADLLFYGGTTALEYNSKDPIIKGRYFNESDYDSASSVCVLTESGAKLLFGTTDVVGMTFEATAWGTSCEMTIIGIRADSSASLINMLNGGGYVVADTPSTFLANKFYYYNDDFDTIYIFSESNEYCSDVAKKAKSLMESKYDCVGENQIMVESFSDYSAQYDTILNVITLFVSLVAAISLMVGGIGVMNIMLVSVTERTREIGIRKALGARTKSIMLQFLAEAGIITLIGGLVGILIGVAGAFGICAIVGFNASISIFTIILTAAFSCGVGLFFGIYPAKKASSLRPIEALRHE